MLLYDLVCVVDGCVQAASDRPVQGVEAGPVIAEEKLGRLPRDNRERSRQTGGGLSQHFFSNHTLRHLTKLKIAITI